MLEDEMEKYELAEDEKIKVRLVAKRWATFRPKQFRFLLKSRKFGKFRDGTKKAKKVRRNHNCKNPQTHSTPNSTQKKRKRVPPTNSSKNAEGAAGEVNTQSSGRKKGSGVSSESSSSRETIRVAGKAKGEASAVSEDRLQFYRRQAALKMWSTSYLEQPPVNQIIDSLAKAFSLSHLQVAQEFKELMKNHPYEEIVSLEKRTFLQHNLLDEKMCALLSHHVLTKCNKQLQPHLDYKKKSSMATSTVLWDDFKPRSAWRSVFNLLPHSFFADVGAMFRSMSEASFVAETVDLPFVFVPRRIQLNVYPAGKLSGLAEHWDRFPMLGVATILLTPIDGHNDDLFLNAEFGPYPTGPGWVTSGLRRGSGVCVLVGTTHAVRTWVRKQPRVTLNVIF